MLNFPYTNELLRRLSPIAVATLGPLERVTLPIRMRLDKTDIPDHVFFLEDGVCSVVADVDGKLAVELGIVGREGFIGLHAVYGDNIDPFQVIMQVDGSAIRVESDRLRLAMAESEEVGTLMLRYARAFSIQVATTALANGRSKLDERLARWLLMVSDRVGSTFPITHEFISMMLGVRRPGVTLAVQILEGNGLIRATRGVITIIDRQGLIDLANGAYGFAEKHQHRLLGADA
jgi:CRP-like cAMP-binding protein